MDGMTNTEIDETIESIRGDAEADIEDFRRIFNALITLRAQRDALAETAKQYADKAGVFDALGKFTREFGL